jgi:CheY-like chemotaxis protein
MSTILIVDDEPTARETVVAMLEGENYDLQLAKDGLQALKVLENIQPDLILLDIMLPGMDGFEVCLLSCSQPWMTATHCCEVSNRAQTIFSASRRTAAS